MGVKYCRQYGNDKNRCFVSDQITKPNEAAAKPQNGKSASSPRAAASIVFAGASLYLWYIYGQVHALTSRRIAMHLHEKLSLAEKELACAYFILAGLAALWCLWSWLTEKRLAAAVATVFTLIAVALVTTMFQYITP